MTIDELSGRVASWLDGSGPRADVVLSSRVRLARNVTDAAFPHRADERTRDRVLENVGAACESVPELAGTPCWDLGRLPRPDGTVLVERHLASPRLAAGTGPRGVRAADDERLSVMINEEDHLRIQCVTSGFDLQEPLGRAVAADRRLENVLDYAVDDERGYLTACPTNVGTGLRASVLIHLPALVLAGEIRKVSRAVSEMGMAVRGWFGEGSGALGDFYQFSNQRTLGRSEEQTVEDLAGVTERVLELETAAREKLRRSQRRWPKVEDRVHRSNGVLRHARMLTAEELMACASDLRLGRWLEMSGIVAGPLLNRLALFGQPGHLGKRLGRELSEDEESCARAEWVRAELAAAAGGGTGPAR